MAELVKLDNMLSDRICSVCRKRELISYFPVYAFPVIKQEIECENCGWYVEYEYAIADVKVLRI